MKIIFPKQGEPTAQPDPYIIKAEDKYYIYATGSEGVEVYSSKELFSGWEYLGIALKEAGMREFWAPCVIEKDGLYYMYYSSLSEKDEDVHKQAIKVAVSSSPAGDFQYKNTLIKAFSIDPHVVKNDSGYYIFYSANDYESQRAGTYIAVDKMKDMFTVENEPVRVVVPTLDEEIFMKNRFRQGQDWHTIEGAFYFSEGNRHYLMYSGNCYESEYYFVGYAYAESGELDLRKVPFRKMPSENTYAPILKRNEEEEGTGHNSVIKTEGNYYIVYHARDIGNRKPYDTRTARVCPLVVSAENLYVKRV